jgi:hypothetical protein
VWFSRISHRRSLLLASLKKLLEKVHAGCLLLGPVSGERGASSASADGTDLRSVGTHEIFRQQGRGSNGVGTADMAAFDVQGQWHVSLQATCPPDNRGWDDTARCRETRRWQGRMQGECQGARRASRAQLV